MPNLYPILLVEPPRPGRERHVLEHRFTSYLQKLRARSGDRQAEAVTIGIAELMQEQKAAGEVELCHGDMVRIRRRAMALAKHELERDGLRHLKQDDRRRIERLWDGPHLVTVQSEHHADELAAQLHAEFPWMSEATERVWHDMRASVRDGLPGLRLRPVLLDGPPGIGKSVWARRLGMLVGAPSLIYEATAENASFGLVGSQKAWSNSSPGRLVNLLIEHRVGNPVVVVDEFEKAGSSKSSKGRSFDLAASMLPLLEPATAKRWSCPYFEVPLDLSWVIWVMTSNNWRLLPEPLLSRCPPIRLSSLTLEDLVGFARREGARRGLSSDGIEAIAEMLARSSDHSSRLSLRSVIRSLDLAATLQNRPALH